MEWQSHPLSALTLTIQHLIWLMRTLSAKIRRASHKDRVFPSMMPSGLRVAEGDKLRHDAQEVRGTGKGRLSAVECYMVHIN
jgi:hypothetical protein